jgi:hypothetical protein
MVMILVLWLTVLVGSSQQYLVVHQHTAISTAAQNLKLGSATHKQLALLWLALKQQ